MRNYRSNSSSIPIYIKELMHLYFSIKKHFIAVSHNIFQLFFITLINNKTVMDRQAWHALRREM